MTPAEVRHHVMAAEGLTFSVSAKLVEDFVARQEAARIAATPVGTRSSYTPEEEDRMLVELGLLAAESLDRRAADVRSRPPLMKDGVVADQFTLAILTDRVNAEVCRLITKRGGSAMVRPDMYASYRQKGSTTVRSLSSIAKLGVTLSSKRPKIGISAPLADG